MNVNFINVSFCVLREPSCTFLPHTAGYNEQLRISDAVLNQLPHLPGSSGEHGSSDGSSGSSSGGCVLELSEQAVLYLSHVFDIYDSTRSGVLSPMDLEHMFNRAPVPIYQVGWGIDGRNGVRSHGDSGRAAAPALQLEPCGTAGSMLNH